MNVRFEAAALMFGESEPKTRVMTHVSRPLIALLLGAVVFFAVWTVALKPHSSTSGGGSSTGVGSYQSAIDKAHQAVTTSDKASVAHGGTLPRNATTSTPAATTATTTPAATTATTTPATTTHAAGAAATKRATTSTTASTSATATPVSAAQRRLSTTESAIDSGKVVALLFYNPAGADDQAVRQELDAVPTNGNKVVKLAVPLSEAGKYTFITANVQLDSSPTLVLIDRAKKATTIVGFADRYEIAQRVADTLAVPAK